MEFTGLMAGVMALAALSTDIMIPGLLAIRHDLQIETDAQMEMIVSLFLFGQAPGQLLFGPLSDAIGRKPAMLTGLAIFLLGSLLTTLAPSYTWLALARIIQGFGLGAPRTLILAIIRDRYVGAPLARMVSNIMSVFACVPIMAPVLGQFILIYLGWRAVFGFVFLLGLSVWLWFFLRQEETLPPDARLPMSVKATLHALIIVCGDRSVLVLSLVTGCIFSGFVAYMSVAALIFQQIYRTGDLFGFYFALTGVGMVAASYLNGRWVARFGIRPLCHIGLIAVLVSSLAFGGWVRLTGTEPSIACVLVYLTLVMFIEAALYANFNALAMEPLRQNTGMGSAVVRTVSMLSSVPLGMGIARCVSTSIWPFAIGLGILAASCLVLMQFACVPPQPRSRAQPHAV
jgi:MFS transporter, DHA1 family, multidrug resistance protein